MGLHSDLSLLSPQGFIQTDFDLNGNPVYFNADGTGLQRAGTLNYASYIFADAGRRILGNRRHRPDGPNCTTTHP